MKKLIIIAVLVFLAAIVSFGQKRVYNIAGNNDSSVINGLTTLDLIRYNADKSGSYTSRSVPDVAWVNAGLATTVKKTGVETIAGNKTFTNVIAADAGISVGEGRMVLTSDAKILFGSQDNGEITWDTNRAIFRAKLHHAAEIWSNGARALKVDTFQKSEFTNAVKVNGTVTLEPAMNGNQALPATQLYKSHRDWWAFGDSFTSSPERYVSGVMEKLFLKSVTIQAVSGNRLDQQVHILDSILTAAPDCLDTVEMISLLVGVNDYAAGNRPLGTVNDAVGANTIAGKLKQFIELYTVANPAIQGFIMSPTEGDGAGVAFNTKNAMGWDLTDLASMMSQVAGRYATQFVDIHRLAGFNELTIDVYTGDGLHPVGQGRTNIANVVADAFMNCSNKGSIPPSGLSPNKVARGGIDGRPVDGIMTDNGSVVNVNGAIILDGSPGGQGAEVVYVSKAGCSSCMSLNVKPDGIFYFLVGQQAKMVLNETGRVGIGTVSPQATLDINGDVKASIPNKSTADSLVTIDDNGYFYRTAVGNVAGNKIARTASGDGVTTSFDVILPSAASWAMVGAGSQAAANNMYWTVSGTTLTIVYDTPPANGTNNLSYWIEYK